MLPVAMLRCRHLTLAKMSTRLQGSQCLEKRYHLEND